MDPQTAADEGFMRAALALADEAAALGEVPVGAVAVVDGQVVGRGSNRREIDRDPFSHAELLAMREAAQVVGAWRLSAVTVYVTLEPCAMCAGAMVQARVGRLVFGAVDPKAGAVGSLYDLAREARHNHQVSVTAGVLAEECGAKLKQFFQALRARNKEKKEK
ncbi:MAG: tRNA adenosine(34) deaminase TadA [Myxococcota bacterium]|jgi:tRNA(adenine34) deaminase